ncbi:MAG: peptidoglycan DD-metalloendopeptidase family protein [Patescibacteria group bacterium]
MPKYFRIFGTLTFLFVSVSVISTAPAFLLAEENTAATEELSSEDEAGKEVAELKKMIADRNAEVEGIEKEIALYQKQIDETGKESDSLKKELKILEAEKGKLLAEIKATEKKISITNTNINNLNLGIAGKNESINKSLDTLGAIIKNVDSLESKNIVELVLAEDKISDIWESMDTLISVENALKTHIENVRKLKQNLEDNKKNKEAERKKLLGFKATLADQKKIVEINQSDKNTVLKETNNKESEYRKLLSERLTKKNKLEREIYEFESKLRVDIDPASLPPAGGRVLSWPLDFVKITQYFGDTPFATKNPQVYHGKGHNGIDLKASVGTKIKASLGGRVVGTGNTDTSCYKASYGKWVLLEHGNGLSTIYGHLSLIKVSQGEIVSTGQVIGYSGNTGYTTGPHLHFTVLASKAVRISEPTGPNKYISITCGTYLRLPISPQNGYLNPLSYL